MKTQFCIWLVHFLLKRKATRKEINDAWRKSTYYDGKDISRNTFLEYKRKAEELFDIDIICDRRTNQYFIEEPEALESDQLKKWLLSSLSAVTTIKQSKNLSQRIMLEQTFGGESFLPTITEAMSSNLCINMIYKPFWYDAPYSFRLNPYFIRLFKQRWYLIGFSHKHKMVRVFAFDRIQEVNITEQKFTMPEGLNVDNYFFNNFGIIQQDDIKPETIRLKFIAEQGVYIETKPLHRSQRLVNKNSESMIFELYLKPSFDFFQEILSYGSDVEVLTPESLRIQVTQCVQCMAAIYDIKRRDLNNK